MTKAEYESSTAIIIADNKLGHTNRMIELRYIDAEYIASLEAENKLLNAAMDKAIEIFADDGAIACPALKVDYECNDGNGCNKLDSCDTSACWREFLMQADGATQKELK